MCAAELSVVNIIDACVLLYMPCLSLLMIYNTVDDIYRVFGNNVQ
jgi:hypothetical protein